LTASQRTGYTKRRKQIWEALHPAVQEELDVGTVMPFDPNDDPEQDEIQVGHVAPPEFKATGYKQPPPQTQGFAAATAVATGQSKATTNRAIARADALGDETLTKVTNTSLDSGVELDALAKLDAPERAQCCAGPAVHTIESNQTGEALTTRMP